MRLLLLFALTAAVAAESADPIRWYGNHLVDLRPLWQWESTVKQHGKGVAGPRPLADWLKLHVAVQDNSNGVVHLFATSVEPLNLARANVFLKNYPGYPAKKGKWMDIHARRISIVQRSLTDWVIVCDYGTPVDSDRAATFVRSLRQPAPTELERDAAEQRAVVYQHQQATNGLPSFQYELGLRYLKGDGVATNLTTALHWFRSAATNGHTRAREMLTEMQGRSGGE